MKAKVLVLAAVLLVAAASGVFAFGIGLQYNGNAGDEYYSGVAVTFKVDSIPLIFAVNWSFVEDSTQFGITGDYWILNDKITNVGSSASLNWFIGVGFFADFAFPDDEFVFQGGVRVPVGLNMFVGKVFEPFLMVAPSFGVQLVPQLDMADIFFPISAGFRFWFK